MRTPFVYAGDTNTARALDNVGAAAKAERETAALVRIRGELQSSSWLIEMIDRYEAQADPAARLVRYLDKVMPKLTHRRNGCAAVTAIGMSFDDMMARHRSQGSELQRTYPEMPLVDRLFRAACAACEAAYPPSRLPFTPPIPTLDQIGAYLDAHGWSFDLPRAGVLRGHLDPPQRRADPLRGDDARTGRPRLQPSPCCGAWHDRHGARRHSC